jgi:hypothetical protein
MIEDGLWLDRRRRLPSVHQPRNRRARVGELIQIDGSRHFWFENRGPECTLIAYIDDATSRILHAAFVPSESTLDYLCETRAYVARHGRPIAFYSDKHAIFRVNKRDAAGGDGMTQFGRALHELNIDILCANSAQAKGRVERSFGTLQDRLVKELRLAGIATLDAANVFLPRFLEAHNARFGKPSGRCRRRPSSTAGKGGARGRFRLEGRAHGLEQPDASIRQDPVHPGAERGDAPPRPRLEDGPGVTF